MEEQEWRRNGRRHATQRGNQNVNGVFSPRATRANGGLLNHTVASSNKSVWRKNEALQNGGNSNGNDPNNGTIAPPSRWKEMRQAVRIKATLDTEDRRPTQARIADLCEDDREKVAKLVRRIVEVGALHEQSESEFQRQRALMETEIHELRDHAKHDAREIDELSEKLKAALEKLRDYQERVLVLEESNELEVKHRLETDQTMDLLKLEVDKLRKLVKKQKLEMETKESEQTRKHREEMERMAQELKETHELLLRERRERLEEKQRELELRIQRSASPTGGGEREHAQRSAGTATVVANKYDSPETATTANASASQQVPFDLSSFLNTSTELPDKIKEIMNEWKSRMEDALNTTAASIANDGGVRGVSTACQTEFAKMMDDASFSSPRPAFRQEDSPTTRMEKLMHGLHERERKLAGVVNQRRGDGREDPSFLRDVDLFNDIKDVYEQRLDEGRRAPPRPLFPPQHHDDDRVGYGKYGEQSSPVSPSSSAHSLSVQDAIEKDMEALLREEGFPLLRRR